MKRLPAPPAPALTADERIILDAFRKMIQRGKEHYLFMMPVSADKYPQRAPPALRLVPGGGA